MADKLEDWLAQVTGATFGGRLPVKALPPNGSFDEIFSRPAWGAGPSAASPEEDDRSASVQPEFLTGSGLKQRQSIDDFELWRLWNAEEDRNRAASSGADPIGPTKPPPQAPEVARTSNPAPAAALTMTKAPFPNALTPDHWRRNKGAVAWAFGKTGLGKALSDLRKAHDELEWNQVALGKKPNPFTLELAQTALTTARNELEANEKLTAVHARAQFIRELAESTAERWRARKTIPKFATGLCDEVKLAAEDLQRSSDVGLLTAQLHAQYETWVKPHQLTFDVLHTGIPAKVEICLATLLAVRTEEDRGSLKLMTKCRNITQFIGNAEKLAAMGFPVRVDIGLCKELTKQLEPYAQNEWLHTIENAQWEEQRNRLEAILLRVRALFG